MYLLCFILLVHNILTCTYACMLAKWYLSMSTRNMHAVEEATIGQVFDKARFLKIDTSAARNKFYYTRPGGWYENLSEMMGSRNFLRWLIPLPHYRRQYQSLVGDARGGGLDYMRFDRGSLKDLAALIYRTEKKTEDDLISSGFKLRKRTKIPKHLEQIIGKIE